MLHIKPSLSQSTQGIKHQTLKMPVVTLQTLRKSVIYFVNCIKSQALKLLLAHIETDFAIQNLDLINLFKNHLPYVLYIDQFPWKLEPNL